MFGTGIIIGVVAFLLIGIFHPIVIKAEYHFSKSIWPLFLAVGIVAVLWSLFIENVIISSALAIFGMCSIWSIGELFQQEKRVDKGWFPKNPNKR